MARVDGGGPARGGPQSLDAIAPTGRRPREIRHRERCEVDRLQQLSTATPETTGRPGGSDHGGSGPLVSVPSSAFASCPRGP